MGGHIYFFFHKGTSSSILNLLVNERKRRNGYLQFFFSQETFFFFPTLETVSVSWQEHVYVNNLVNGMGLKQIMILKAYYLFSMFLNMETKSRCLLWQ